MIEYKRFRLSWVKCDNCSKPFRNPFSRNIMTWLYHPVIKNYYRGVIELKKAKWDITIDKNGNARYYCPECKGD